MPTSTRWISVCYGDGKFVAISGGSYANNGVIYSADGINWTYKALLQSDLNIANDAAAAIKPHLNIVLPDLAQNDSTQPDYVKGRTHYMAIKVVDKSSDIVLNSVSVPFTYGCLPNTKFGTRTAPKMPEGKYLLFKLGDVSHKITHTPPETSSGYREAIVLENGVTIRYELSSTDSSGKQDRKQNLYCRVFPVYAAETEPYFGQTFSIQLVEDVPVPLDEKYIPNSIPKVQTATVGQPVTVKAVDANGKPTEWEASNFPSDQVTPDMVMDILYDTGAIVPLANSDGSILTTSDDKILVFQGEDK
jgi:hypothetical protein